MKRKRGGARKGAGAKLKYGEPIIYAPVYVPKSKKKEIMAKIKEVVKEYEVRFVIENTSGLYLNHHSAKNLAIRQMHLRQRSWWHQCRRRGC